MVSIDLKWKSHNINLDEFEKWARSTVSLEYVGNSASTDHLKMWFKNLSQQDESLVLNKWLSLDDVNDPIVTSYKSEAQKKAEALAAKLGTLDKIAQRTQTTVEELKLVFGIE